MIFRFCFVCSAKISEGESSALWKVMKGNPSGTGRVNGNRFFQLVVDYIDPERLLARQVKRFCPCHGVLPTAIEAWQPLFLKRYSPKAP